MAGSVLPSTCDAVLWVGMAHAVYRGPSLGLGAHSSAVPCVVVGLDGPFRLTVGERVAGGVRSALVPPRTVHRVGAPAGTAMLFCHLELPAARSRGIADGAADRVGTCATGLEIEPVLAERASGPLPDVDGVLAAVVGPVSHGVDPRIARAVAAVAADPAGPHPAVQAAADAGLSPSHFLRLFARETGTSFRRHRAWARLLRACEVVDAGGDLTRAAADAGFASPSHFSDTVSRTFGLSATDLLASGARLVVRAGADTGRSGVDPAR